MQFPLGVVPAVAKHDGVASLRGSVLCRPGQGREEGVADVQNNQADRAAVTCPQLAGHIVADKAEFGNGCLDAVQGL